MPCLYSARIFITRRRGRPRSQRWNFYGAHPMASPTLIYEILLIEASRILTFAQIKEYDFSALKHSVRVWKPETIGGQPLSKRFVRFVVSFMGGHAGSRKTCRLQSSGLPTCVAATMCRKTVVLQYVTKLHFPAYRHIYRRCIVA